MDNIFEAIYWGLIIMETTKKVPGSKLLDDRASLQAYVVGNNELFNKKITKIADKNFSKIK